MNELEIEIEIQAIKLAIFRIKGSGVTAEVAEAQHEHLMTKLNDMEYLKLMHE